MILISNKELIDKALIARNASYSPYSSFKVGAAILCDDGEVFTGCNIENAAFSHTVCAERVAIFKALSQGKRRFDAIAIVGGKDEVTDFTYPCGACRQVLSEFCGADLKIVLFNGNSIKLSTLGELFPFGFDKDSIK